MVTKFPYKNRLTQIYEIRMKTQIINKNMMFACAKPIILSHISPLFIILFWHFDLK